jgi:hypothetical protein
MTGRLNKIIWPFLLLIGLLISCFVSYSQTNDWASFNQNRLNTDKKLMLTLGSWSVANAGASAYGWATTDLEAKYFHQMNVMWSGINLALAVPGYLKAIKSDANAMQASETMRLQHQTEKVFLFNAGLDLGYIASGFFLKQRALNDLNNYHRFRGWGNAIILQGGFLFLFDLSAYLIHANHRKDQMHPLLDRLELSDNGLGIKWQL